MTEARSLDNHDGPFVSVIIPVYNDPDRLSTCLGALERQTYPSGRYEVVVVDNGSEESIKPIADVHPHAAVAYESGPGSYAARNRGLKIARGSVLAFTDADCVPTPHWIEEGVQCLLANPNCGLVGGRIELHFRNPNRLSAVELHERVTVFNQKDAIEQGHYSVTANLFTQRKVFTEVGPFNATLKSSGDLEWGQRVYDAGYSQIYCSGALVYHPARRTLRAICRKEARLFGGRYERRARDKGIIYNVLRILWISRPPIRYIREKMKDDRVRSARELLQILGVELVRRGVRIREQVRLTLGGQPRR